ncbi:LacI family DNA-binding transcriptional regulator [Mediterraneibacter faecis]|uniref:LacI family DNA-binding transcriptional regulator n=1 Tax=Mediterraneibacter faecis TaxID=592978 RepID=UPI003F9AA776
MKIKMVDIARHLGVSKATVSLAVNGKPGVNEETRRMVLECLEEMMVWYKKS